MIFQSSGSISRFQPVFFTVGKFENKNKKLKFSQKEDFTSYLPFSISYSPTVHTVQNSQAFNYKSSFFIYLFFHFLLDPDPGKNSGSMWIRIRIHVDSDPDPQHCLPGSWGGQQTSEVLAVVQLIDNEPAF